MIMRLCFLFLLVLSVASCGKDDPCDLNANSLECPTGDFDGDGVVNEDDSAPSDACVPNIPSFEENIIGTWDWALIAYGGRVKINEDGTYEDIEDEILSNGEVTSRTWRIENDQLIFDVENATLSLAWKEYDCTSITFDGMDFIPDPIFTKVQ